MMEYSKAYAAMQPAQMNGGASRPAQRIRYVQSSTCAIVGFVGAEFELFAVFDSLVQKTKALEICQRLAAWVKANQSTLFVPV